MSITYTEEIKHLFIKLGVEVQDDGELANACFIINALNYYDSSNSNNDISNSQVKKIIKQYQMTPFTIKDSKSIDRLCELFRVHHLSSFEHILDAMMQFAVSERKTYLSLFDKKGSPSKLGILSFLLKTHRDLQAGEINCDPAILYDQRKDIKQFLQCISNWSEREFTLAWNAVFIYKKNPIPVKLTGNISKAIKLYRQHYVPMSALLSDYNIINEHANDIEHAVNPWKMVRKDMQGIPVIEKYSVDEMLFIHGADLIKNEQPTDVIRGMFVSESNNDSAFECGFLLKEFSRISSPAKAVLIVNPTPDYILLWINNKDRAGKNVYFAVNSEMVKAYSRQFPKISFISYDDAKNLNDIEALLIRASGIGTEQMRDFMGLILHCKSYARIMLLMPNASIDKAGGGIIKEIVAEKCQIKRILLLDSGLTKSSPRKKALLYVRKTDDPSKPYSIPFYHTYDIDDDRFGIDKNHIEVNITAINGTRTLVSLWGDGVRKKKNQKEKAKPRHIAERYQFSKEIQISYSIQKNKKGSYAGKAYYRIRTSIDDEGMNRGERSKVTEKGLRAKSRKEVIGSLEIVPFADGIRNVIIDNVMTIYRDSLSELTLKTLWFCIRPSLMLVAGYEDTIAKEMFCGQFKEHIADIQPAIANEIEINNAMKVFPQGRDYNTGIKYWEQLNQIMKKLLSEKIIRYNPVPMLMQSFSKRATAAEREVRNALVKKTFTAEEEAKCISFLLADTKVTIENRTVQRYEKNSLLLCFAIRLFSGMALREVCALTWSDFVRIPNVGSYKLIVTKSVGDDGREREETDALAWNKYRLVPVALLLAEMLLKRKEYIMSLYGIEESEIRKMPIVLEKEKIGHNGKIKYCKPLVANNACNKILAKANIASNTISLPDGNETKETDLSKYYGDIFLSHFRYRANHVCKMTRGEINYIIGVKPPDTFSENYCDYTNDFIQYEMACKLRRWSSRFTEAKIEDGIMPKIVLNESKSISIEAANDKPAAIDLELIFEEKQKNNALKIMVDCENGFFGSVVCYDAEEVKK